MAMQIWLNIVRLFLDNCKELMVLYNWHGLILETSCFSFIEKSI